MMSTDYLCEQKLQAANPQLHGLFRNSVFSLQRTLRKYQTIFPNYTDHTSLHSLEVIDFCNALIGKNIERMSADELYVLLMSAYLHDSGMGITRANFEAFSPHIPFEDYFEQHSKDDIPTVIRDFHHEFSGEYIKKYARFFDIPSPQHLFAIVQVSRGHRKTNLYDEAEYPTDLVAPSGSTICVPYLSGLIRLADELDIAADRNLQFMYDIDHIDNEISRMEFRKHQAIRKLTIHEKEFVMEVDASDPAVFAATMELRDKLSQTLTECREVIRQRTPFSITQEEIIVLPI